MTLRRSFFATALAAAATLAGAPASAQQVIKLTAVAGHPPSFLWVKMLDEVFIPEVDRRLAAGGNKYKIDWTKAYGASLIKLGAESKGIGDGIADVGTVAVVYEASKFPLQNVTLFAPFGTGDAKLISSTISDLQDKFPAMRDAWTKSGLTYLGGIVVDNYQMVTNFPIKSIDDLRGKKISAAGPLANWVNGTGAVAVASSLTTAYEDIKSGVSDGYMIMLTGVWAAKLYEVAPYITMANFGAQYAGGIVFNKRRFDRLPPEVQKAVREAGDEWTAQYAKRQAAEVDVVVQKMKQGGAKFSDLPEAERKRWADAMPPIGKIWAKELDSKGLPADKVLDEYIADLKKGGADLPRDWSK